MDRYVQMYVKTYVHIDAGARVWCNGVQLDIIMSGNVQKVALPLSGSKILYSFDDLKRAGAKCDVITLKTLAQSGAEGRWRDNIQERRDTGIPCNVYVANARSIEYALEHGKVPPPIRWVGRARNQITEVYDTVDEVVDAMAANKWRTEFSKGRYAKRRLK